MTEILPTAPPFGGHQLPQVAETASIALAATARAEVEARHFMASRFPRNWDMVRAGLMKDCSRPAFAQVAEYSVPRAGGRITGPSIRFVEAALRCMGHAETRTQTIFDDEEKRIVEIRVWDFQSCTSHAKAITIAKTIERKQPRRNEVVIRKRTGSDGQDVFVVKPSEDELITREAALVSKAIRTLGLKLIPGDLVDECLQRCADTRENQDQNDPEAARRKLLDAFQRLGVSPADLVEYLGHSTEAIQPAELKELRGLYASLRDGETTWADVVADRADTKEAKAETAQKSKKSGVNGREATKKKIAELRIRNSGRYAEVCAQFEVSAKSADWQNECPEEILADFLAELMKEGGEA